jgi:hypothetical protein
MKLIISLMELIIDTLSNRCDIDGSIRPRGIAVGLRATRLRTAHTLGMLLHGVVLLLNVFTFALMTLLSALFLSGRKGCIAHQSVFLAF